MSFRNVQQNTVKNHNTLSVPPVIAGSVAGRGAGAGWIRNPSWLTMPTITSANEEVDMLVPIYPESNFIAFTFNTSAGTYSVDWGDGTSGTFTSATAAQKQYDYTTAALANTNAPVTFQQSGSTVTRSNHGYTNGYPISFASITTTTGITATQLYYVINATTNTFQLAASRGGTALTLTNDGTGIILPYKQAIIKVTPTTGGATFTTVNLQVKNTTTGLNAYAQPVMDLTISAACTSLTIQGATPVVPMNILEKCTILRHASTSFANLFLNCNALQSVSITNTTANNLSNAFSKCTALQNAPLFNTAAVTTFANCFTNCLSLTSVPVYNTSNVSNMYGAFSFCPVLTTIPLIDTSNVTVMANTFDSCTALTSIPLLNTVKVANMYGTFRSCNSLPTIPLLNTSNVTVLANTFENCSNLTSIPLLNTVNVANMTFTFRFCTSLTAVPPLNTSNVANFVQAFQITGLTQGPNIDTSKGTNLFGMFDTCSSLTNIPTYNTANATNMTGMFNGCYSLQEIPYFNVSNVTNNGSLFGGGGGNYSIKTASFNTGGTCVTSFVFNNANYSGLQTLTYSNCANFFNTTILSPSLSSITTGLPLYIYNPLNISNCKFSGPALDVIYTSLGRVGGSVTFQGNPTNTVTIVGHGYTGGESIQFSVITTTTGISSSTTYWVRNVTTDTFQLSATPTGSILTLTNNGTGTRSPASITVSGNWGIATDTPSIATAKGWTVTGS